MIKPGLPFNEEERLFQLRSYNILDTAEEKTFDHITELAAELCGTEVSLITLIDENRQWFKSRHNLSVKETHRDISFCGHTILGNGMFIVPDARKDERFSDNPIVTGPPNVIFYAGVPLSTSEGVNLGTLCVIDSVPKELTNFQKKILDTLARQVVDLLELRKKNKQLMTLSQQYLDVQKMAKTGGWELLAETGEITWSAEIYSIYGLALESKPSLKDCVKFYAPHEQERISKLYWDSLQTGKGFDEVFEFRDNYYNEKWIHIIGEAVKGPDGKILKLKGTFQDITEHKKTELELRRLLESNRFVLGTLGVGAWKVDFLSDKHEWDETMYRLYGTSPQKFSPDFQSWISFLTPESKKTIEKVMQDVTAGAENFQSTLEIITSEGEKRFLGYSARVIRNESGKPVTMLGINWDRSHEMKLQNELESERAKILHHAKLASIGQLAAGVGHEINNPLSIISSLLTILTRSPDEARRPEFIVKMEDAIDRITSIVKGLRTFARSDMEEVTRFETSVLIKETVNFLKEIYEKEGVQIRLKNDSQGIRMSGNRGRIQQILVNLINNAKDATQGRQERLIDVIVSASGSDIQITVRDNGSGIPEGVQDKIFDPFFTTKDVNLGTGIGLSIVNTIVKEHHGKIDFTSTPDKGTEFRVLLPVNGLGSESREELRSPQHTNEIVERNVLLIDDERDLLEAMEMILKLSFKKVYTARSAEEGLKIVGDQKIDLILSDIKMPIMDGFEFLRKLKESSRNEDTKILFLTGGIDMTPEELTIVRTQTSGIIPKPIRFPDLMSKVRELFPS